MHGAVWPVSRAACARYGTPLARGLKMRTAQQNQHESGPFRRTGGLVSSVSLALCAALLVPTFGACDKDSHANAPLDYSENAKRDYDAAIDEAYWLDVQEYATKGIEDGIQDPRPAS